MNKLFFCIAMLICISVSEAFPQQIPEYELKKGAYVESETFDIIIQGDKLGFIQYVIYKKIKYKITSAKGAKMLSEVCIPQFPDPTYFSHASDIRNIGNYFVNTELKHFRSTIKKPNSTYIDSAYRQSIKLERTTLNTNKYYNIETFVFKSSEIEAGDEVTIEYKLAIPYMANFSRLTSLRVFFNDSLYKQAYAFKLSHKTDLLANISYFNKGEPSESYEKENTTHYIWNKNNLSGCIKEEGSIPYKELPNLTIAVKPLELLYTLPHTFEKKFLPYFTIPVMSRENTHMGIIMGINQGVKSKQYSLLNSFIEARTSNIQNDTNGLTKLKETHNFIVNNFTYQDDKDFFIGKDIREPRFGEFLSSNIVREINRYDNYIAIISKLGLPYFTCYISDNRIGEISDYNISPMFDSDYLIAPVISNSNVHYIYPKNNKFGLYMDELPFYFENTKCRLISLNDYMDYDKPINEKKRYSKTPGSNSDENVRKSDVLVNINLDSLSCRFKSRVQLNGQFSTITRGLYKNGFMFKHVNPAYNYRIWDINKSVKSANFSITKEESEFPFKFNFTAEYQFDSLLQKRNNTLYINCKNLIKHTLYKDIDSNTRQLGYYPDFGSTDSYTYFLQFSKDINLISKHDLIKVSNEFGVYEFSIEQTGKNSIKITSYLLISGREIPVEKIATLQKITDYIKNNDNQFIEIEIAKQ